MNALQVCERLAQLTADVAAKRVTPSGLKQKLQELAEAIGDNPQEEMAAANTSKSLLMRASARRCVEFWRDRMRPKARITPDRISKVAARMRDGYTEEEIKKAIMGCASSPFHMGENEQGKRYDAIELICRNSEKLENFILLAPDTNDTDEVAALRARVKDAMKRGDTRGYERANSELREAMRSAG